MLELRVKRVLDVSVGTNGEAVVSMLAEGRQEEALNKLSMAKGKDMAGYVLRLLKPKKKKSLDANAYMWVLCDKLAEALETTKENVYRTAIRHVGAFTDVTLEAEAARSMIAGWEHNGTGWITEIVDDVAEEKTVRFYYGSSAYDSKEMARLIDEIIVYCKDFGIEHLPPDDLERMKAAWGETAT